MTPGEWLTQHKRFNLQNSDFRYNPKNRFNPYLLRVSKGGPVSVKAVKAVKEAFI
jgi:hypothetical protein